VDSELLDLPEPGEKLTHYLFRYPAKFHPPVVRALLDRYSQPGDRLFDPFCGSGTGLVQAAVRGMKSVGTDIDPVAVAVSQAKTRRYEMPTLQACTAKLLARLAPMKRDSAEYEARMFVDLEDEEYADELGDVWLPAIPKLNHWFRRYVLVDLARINREIDELDAEPDVTCLLSVVLASIIRNASNADPVPVSGLEVTSHMIAKDVEGRLVNPYALFKVALVKAVEAVGRYSELADPRHVPEVMQADAADLGRCVKDTFQLSLTSPPYHNAVDYYRRHQLEMFWLRHVADHQERLQLLPKYIGRQRIPLSHPTLASDWFPSALAKEWDQQMREVSVQRANDFKHYMISMDRVFDGLSERICPGGRVLFVVGQSSWNGDQIPTTKLFTELASPDFELEELLHYPVRNRYMSYARKNGADINTEHVLVLKRQ